MKLDNIYQHPVVDASRLNTKTFEDFLHLDGTPYDEECTQANPEKSVEQAMHWECNAMINQLIRINGNPVEGCRFRIVRNYHDSAGLYMDIVVIYNEDIEESVEYAMNVEANFPAKWDEKAIKELESVGHRVIGVAKVVPLRKTA